MKSEQSSIVMSPAASEIRRLADSLKLVFGKSQESHAFQQKCRLALDELESFADGRGVKSTSIAVLGSKNTGKSWLCRQLVKNEAKREQIPCGEESNAATEKATWIGPDAPSALEPEHERRISLRQDDMVDLGRVYTLLDLPGFDDAGVDARDAALKAIRGVEFRVMVVSGATKQIESQFAYLRDSDGTHILPVLVDGKYPLLEIEGRSEVQTLIAKIKMHCPFAEVAPPIIIPHIEHAPGTASDKLKRVEELLLPALKSFIALPPVDEAVISRVVLERLRREISQDLQEFFARVAPAHDALVVKEAGLAGDLVKKILGQDLQLCAGLRMKMRLYTLSKTPGWLFPYRTFLGIFTITAGAWDRLAFAMAGSLPSLTLLAFQTARNAKRLGEMRQEARDALAERLHSLADDELANCNSIFIRSINSSLPASEQQSESESIQTRFNGLERLTGESAELFESVVRQYARVHGLPMLCGGFATLTFIGLLAGPLWAVYREFIDAWTGVFSQTVDVHWQAFPVPSAGMILASLLLALLPVVSLALLSSIVTTPEARVKAAMDEVKRRHDAMLDRLTHEKIVRLTSDDPVREAVRFLLDFIRGGKRSRCE